RRRTRSSICSRSRRTSARSRSTTSRPRCLPRRSTSGFAARTPGNFTMFVDGPEDEALKLADRMIAETGGFERDERTYFLKPHQTKRLRNAVAKGWNFVKKPPEPDGSVTDSSGVQYIYNGVVKCFSCWVHGTSKKR